MASSTGQEPHGRHVAHARSAQEQPAQGAMRPVDLGPANRKRRGLKVVLGILGVVVVALVAYGVWFAVTLNSTLEKAGDDTISGDALEPTSFGEPFYVLAIGSDSREGSGSRRP